MKDKQLDDIIGKKLERLHSPFPPGSWEQFEQRLDAEDGGVPEAREAELDEAIFNKLHQLQHPYRAGNWSLMSDRLDREFVRPGFILRYKAMEVTLILLIALTLWQFMPPLETGESPVATTATPASDHWSTSKETPSSAGEVSGVSATKQPESPSSGREAPSAGSSGVAISGGIPTDLPPVETETSAPGYSRRPHTAGLLPLTPRQPLIAKENATGLLSVVDDLFAGVLTEEVSTLASLFGQPVMEKTPLGDFDHRIVPVASNHYLFFGMFGGLEYNRIITPADYFLDVETNEFDRFEPGYSGGVSIGADLGAWEVQSGFIYTAKEYPSINLLLRHGNSRDGYTIEQFKDVQLNILQVPLNLSYELFQYDRWRIYLMTGASLHVATHANYFIDKEGARRSLLSERIENGWLEGGTFRENSFLTGNLGFGIERFVTGRWSFFAQPTYQHTIYSFNQGFGPTNDRLNTLSIYTGIRIRIKR